MRHGKRILVLLGAAALMAAVPPARAQAPAGPDRSLEKVKIDPQGAPPPVPIAEIIQQFAAKESEFRVARGEYTYTQTVLVEDLGSYGEKQGEYRVVSDIIFTPEGKRYEKITYAPPSSLKSIGMTPEDERDIANVFPFVLGTEDLPHYDVEYLGRQPIDEIGTYVFSIRPKQIEPGQRYFRGTIWVDDRDLQIVKSFGKSVPDNPKKGPENLFPIFETWREQIDGKYWFPTLTRANDTLHFKGGDVRIRISVRYSNYKRFKSTTRIISTEPIKPEEKKPPQR
ncbi:MAG: hypothetical protein HYR58_06215 [Acidobacteria bacterium]|nr:hypothetical protein [Acidobacteriota bacterium]MBI3483960.1 hypothetical protein [Acidobacteriota bacterium]